MQDDDAARLEDDMRALMTESGLGWAVEQVDEAITEGVTLVTEDRTDAERVGKVEALHRGAVNRRRTEKTRPYTHTERVELLLQAIERAVIQLNHVEQHVVASLAERLGVDSVAFVSEPDEPRKGFDVRPSLSPSRLDQLESSLHELHEGLQSDS